MLVLFRATTRAVITTLLIIFLALAGELYLYTTPILGVIFVFLGILALPLALALWLRGHRPPILIPAAWLLIPATLSTLANLDILPFSLGRLLLFVLALAALVIGCATGESHLRRQIQYAGMTWPVIWAADALTGWAHRADLLGFWPVLFILSFWRSRYWPFVIPHFIILLHRGSRGALVAAIVGVLVYEWLERGRPHPSTGSGWLSIPLAGVIGAFGLVMWRYGTAIDRLSYWRYSWLAFLSNPLYGVGPGGLDAHHLLYGFNGGPHQIHAHNALVSWLAETGIIGLAVLVLVIKRLYCTRHSYQAQHWQLALFAGLLIWSMVDEPLFWPGPLVMVALIFGTVPPQKL